MERAVSGVNTQDLAQRWMRERQLFKSAIASAVAAGEAVNKTGATLAKWIAPKDIKVGEKISVWVRVDRHQEVLIEVEAIKNGNEANTTVELVVRLRESRDLASTGQQSSTTVAE